MQGKGRSVAIILAAQVGVLSVWFVSAAILPQISAEAALSPARAALLSAAVQAGFVLGALGSALSGLADRFDPRRVFCASALLTALATLLLLATPPGSLAQVALRVLAGAALAGVYPVGMKIMVGWGQADRGLLTGALVGALTLGSALPHLVAWIGGADWRAVVLWVAGLAAASGVTILAAGLGPHHATASRFHPGAIALAWTDRRIRLAYAGYLGHMWELYVFWAWVGAATAASFQRAMPAAEAAETAKLVAFVAIAAGGIACIPAGRLADRIGRARVTCAILIASATTGLLTALAWGGAPWLVAALMILWGIAVIPDSAQFSALVADAAPPEFAGSLMTLQTALGFALTAVTVQTAPILAAAVGWPILLAGLAIGPLLGAVAMARLIAPSPGR